MNRQRRWTVALVAAVILLPGAGAWAANNPDARFLGGTHAGYDVVEKVGVKLQIPKGTTISIR